MVSSMRRFTNSEIAQERLKVIKYYSRHGEKITHEAFGVGRKTIFVWKKRLSKAQGKITSLIPSSTKPTNVREMNTSPKVFEFISILRRAHPRLGKDKIYPILKAFCRKEGLTCIQPSTIGKVIKRNNLFYQRQGRLYHAPNSWYARNRTKVRKFRIRYSPKHKELGHIQMDTILRFQDGIKYYFYSAIDTKGKFAFILPYKSLTSANTLDFYQKLIQIIPYEIKSIQTDNGLEFLGLFDAYLQKHGILHAFTYPRCPKINGVVERFNRTIQEEFIDFNLEYLHKTQTFSRKLANYLLFYNLTRVHKALGDIPPIVYLQKEGGMSNNSVTHKNLTE